MPGPVQFAIQTPQIDDRPHIDHALSLGLPEADSDLRTLHLFANGPSAKSAAIPDGDTMAVNGALRLFTDKGRAPSYWIACDPQALVADFLIDPPERTTYLVASKCDPLVFQMLEDRDVRLWHVNDNEIPDVRRVPCAVSVTLCALMLAMRLGYRRIEVYGWDCCYDGEKHHAGTGSPSVTPDRLKIEVGEGEDALWFESNPTWCCEIEDALKILPVLKWCGVEIRIHGPSLLGAIATEYESSCSRPKA